MTRRTQLQSLACGYCEFPLLPSAERCPRCRLELAQCPVCELLPERDGRQAAGRPPAKWFQRKGPFCHCDRCGTRQLRLRHRPSLQDLDGNVCSNLYGCPAGGLLVSPEIAVLLPPGCIVCPVCHDVDRPPVDLLAFLGDVRRCASCIAAMGDPREWSTEQLAGQASLNGELAAHLERIHLQTHTCRMCGRGPGKPSGNPVREAIVEGAALELSRFLWIGKQDEEARRLTREYWRVLGPDWPRHRRREAAEVLVAQTDPRHHHNLSLRLEMLLESLDPKDTATGADGVMPA